MRWGRPASPQWSKLCLIVKEDEYGYLTACHGRWKREDGIEAFDEKPYGRGLCGFCITVEASQDKVAP